MVRADDCGDGVGTTRDGMAIDLCDDKGIQKPDMVADRAFEAGWTQAAARGLGALVFNRSRP